MRFAISASRITKTPSVVWIVAGNQGAESMKHMKKYQEENRPESASSIRQTRAKLPEIDWNSRLATGEELLWTGKPEPDGKRITGRGLDPSGRWIILVLCVGLIGFLLYRVLPEFWNYPLMMLPILTMVAVLGFSLWYLLGGQEPWARYWLNRTRYALTDRRAIIARRVFGRYWAINYPLSEMTPVQRVDQGTTGHVIFMEVSVMSYSKVTQLLRDTQMRRIIGFQFLRDAGTVHRRLQALQSELAGASVQARSGRQ